MPAQDMSPRGYIKPVWTAKMDQVLLSLLDKKKTYSAVADRLGVSRCSVAGRVHRLKRKAEADSAADKAPKSSKT